MEKWKITGERCAITREGLAKSVRTKHILQCGSIVFHEQRLSTGPGFPLGTIPSADRSQANVWLGTWAPCLGESFVPCGSSQEVFTVHAKTSKAFHNLPLIFWVHLITLLSHSNDTGLCAICQTCQGHRFFKAFGCWPLVSSTFFQPSMWLVCNFLHISVQVASDCPQQRSSQLLHCSSLSFVLLHSFP